MFSRLLGSALVDASQLVVDSFETEARQLPPHGAYDGYVLSGSRHGAYEALPWIAELLAWTREAVAKRDRLLGVCFGHQVIAQALGGRVEPNARGFEIGGLGMELTPQARAFFATLLGGDAADMPEAVRMLYVHGCVETQCACVHLLTWLAACRDAVAAMPPGFFALGGSAVSPVNGMSDGGRVLTWQGHPEFDADTVERLLPLLDARGLVPQRLPPGESVPAVRASLQAEPLDTPWLARAAIAFLTLT